MTVRPVLTVLATMLLVAAGGSASAASLAVQPLGASDLARVRAHEAAVVLLRVTETIDGKPVSAARGGDANRRPRFFLANLDEFGAPKKVSPAALTPAAAAADWRYLLLPPGAYYLLLLPPGMEQNPPAVAYSVELGRYGRLTDYALKQGRGGFWSSDLGTFAFAKDPPPDFEALQGFWFQVPRNGEVVYAGSLSVACTGGRGLFGSLIGSCGDFALGDETAAARDLAATALPGLAFESRALVPLGATRPGTRAIDPASLPIVAHGAATLGAGAGGSGISSAATLHGVGAAVNVYNLLVVGGELLAQSSERRKAAQQAAQLQPCLDRLSATLAGQDVARAFATAVATVPRRETAVTGESAVAAAAAEPVAGDVAAAATAAYRASVSLPILRLSDSGADGGLALELGLALRFEDANTGRLDGWALWLSSAAPPRQNPHAAGSPLYTRVVPERAQPHPADAWCGPQGGELLAAEMARALGNIAAQAVAAFE